MCLLYIDICLICLSDRSKQIKRVLGGLIVIKSLNICTSLANIIFETLQRRKVMSVVVLGFPDLKWHRFYDFISPSQFSPQFQFLLRKYIQQLRHCLGTVISTHLEARKNYTCFQLSPRRFVKCGQTRFFMFHILVVKRDSKSVPSFQIQKIKCI